MAGGYQPKGPSDKAVKAPPTHPEQPVEVTGVVITKAEAQRVLAWFGSVTIVDPGDFEIAARIRRALE